MNKIKITRITTSALKTQKLAQEIFQQNKEKLAQSCLVFALEGELGSGKTQFAKGLAKALKIKKIIVSPTFTIIREYPFKIGKIKGIFYHFDAWRIKNLQELKQLKIKQMIKPENILVIEWAEKVSPLLEKWPKKQTAKVIKIKLEHQSPKKRKIKIYE